LKPINKKITCFILVLAFLSLIFSSCELGQTEQKSKIYKIGAILSLTGGASFLGDPEKKTLEMLVEKVNLEGGVNGHPLKLIIMDSNSTSPATVAAFNKLVSEEKVLAIIGPSTSGTTIEILPLTMKHEIPLISCAASHKIVQHTYTKTPYPWVFKTAQSDSMAVEAMYSFMQSKGIKKIAVMNINSGYGYSGLKEIERLAPVYGIDIIGKEVYALQENDMKLPLTRIKALNPQAIINWSIGPSQIAVVQAWKELGMDKIKLFQSHGFGSLKNVQLAGGSAEGVYLPLGAVNVADVLPANHPQKQVTTQYAKEYNEKYQEPVSSFGGHAWDAFYLLVNALEKAGADRAKIRDEIENTKGFVGQGGIFNMSVVDHNGLDKTAFKMTVVKNNTWALAE